eukprot:2423346-Amphidinium_carterae.5
MGNTLQTRWKDEKFESTLCGQRLNAEGQHRRDLRSDSSSNNVEDGTGLGTTQEPQHLRVRHTISMPQHTSTTRNDNTCQTTTRM